MTFPIDILLVEDSPSDVKLMAKAFTKTTIQHQIHVVEDGVEAMAFIRREGSFLDAPRPDLILLDLNLPKKDGREVLSEIKNDPSTSMIPVVILTTSDDQHDIAQSYRMHANCYLIKPASIKDFKRVVGIIEDFWLTCVELPTI